MGLPPQNYSVSILGTNHDVEKSCEVRRSKTMLFAGRMEDECMQSKYSAGSAINMLIGIWEFGSAIQMLIIMFLIQSNGEIGIGVWWDIAENKAVFGREMNQYWHFGKNVEGGTKPFKNASSLSVIMYLNLSKWNKKLGKQSDQGGNWKYGKRSKFFGRWI